MGYFSKSIKLFCASLLVSMCLLLYLDFDEYIF